jgi:hypothetical protein
MVSGKLTTIAASVYIDYDVIWFVEETLDEEGGMQSISLEKGLPD